MTMKTILLAGAAILAASAAGAATLDLRKVTCGDFAKSDSQSLTNVSLWLSGYYMGEDDDAVIDFDRVNKMGNALVQYCAANPKEPVSDAAEKLMGKAK
ncbi:HdeA/HdeB family chaperone [Labrys wisconsinensis]|uniref:Acid stress chaperone HdeB n=1 Tax=Labrys wisconsinensis TaxID=425677 RepID=A0ABU0J5Q6_9HYPH|nr:HdeA/HdeB family chaperone [Labrys wisconsinensis]MDQ0469587.1 acid stress chaperone HdeB [Labrys wisconsinensis]